MKAITAFLMLAAVAGVGYWAYKKMSSENISSAAFAKKEEQQNSDKFHRASMYEVGTIKTTADKISEGVKEVMSGDMVKKGEETLEQIKNSGESFKKQVKETGASLKDHIKETSGNIRDELRETGMKIGDELKESGENIKGDLKEIRNLVTFINAVPGESFDESWESDKAIPDIDTDVSDDNEYSFFEDAETAERF